MSDLTGFQLLFKTLVFAAAILFSNELSAQEQSSAKLTIGTRHLPPFASKNEDGTWDGLSIELWKNIAEKLDVEYEFRDYPLAELLTRVQSGELDAVVAALSVTADREVKMDFSHPFLTSGLGVAVRKNDRNIRGSIWSIVLQPLMLVVAIILLLLVVAGIIVWLVERKRNPESFGGKSISGIGQGIWWAAVTMTTVGYGDISPRTLLGRSVAVVWMLVGIVVVSLFTAFVASKFTTAQLVPTIRSASDLSRVKVAAVRDTTGAEYLVRNGIQHKLYNEPAMALDALKAGSAGAVIYDRPTLRHLAVQDYPEITILPTIFEEEAYAIGFPAGSELRERVNQKLLVYLNSDSWKNTKLLYMGR